MGLLLHLNMSGVKDIPLKSVYPRVYPYTQMVNRVFPDTIDPFRYSLACEPIQDILKLPTNKKKFGDMAEARAMEIKSYPEPIYIMYSGGIDSSSAVISFLRTWSAQELERVFILASHHSAFEFPELWNIIVDKFGDRILPSFRPIPYYCEKGYVITGEHGDQLFGSDVIRKIYHQFGDEGIHKPWPDIMPEIYEDSFGPDIAPKFIALYEPAIHVCPFPIKTSFDWIWWFNFTNKWQHVKYRLLANDGWHTPEQSFKKVRHFFDTPEWQRWSLDNHDMKIGSTYSSYKLAAKEYIVSATGFTSYLTKPKVGSLYQIWYSSKFKEAIDTSFNYLSKEEAMEYIR